MKHLIVSLILCAGTAIANAGSAERVQHFKGAVPDTLKEARLLLVRHNRQLADILADKPLTLEDLAHIHKLTYTLENALDKIKVDLEAVSVVLESLHQASEQAKIEDTQKLGTQYLNSSRQLEN